ncbi:fibronectin type iii domain-containing protein [Fusarium mexicanum]|uniref:Fibronectin type iii domain-containing protein n=1 Tax=Fusarium mexicanum TaxID=751941 RepID=A0A8H5IX19_9HYPO|nr:fibronectin type iii domain-containing protein [Fusarium mexicanum]
MGIPMLIIAVKEYLQTENAYSPSVPNKCVISLRTQAGGNCQTWVQCEQTDRKGDIAGDWQVCYVGGRQFFTHPEVGDFSVTFSEGGGDQDGLHSPIIQLAGYNNWEPFNLDDIIEAQGDSDYGRLCTHGGQPEGILDWSCGVPKSGASAAFGISLIAPDSSQDGFQPGWCTAHVNQYQKNELGTGAKYAFDVVIKDAGGNQIGHIQHLEVDDGGHLSVPSKLPFTFDISAGAVDSDPVTFAYAGQTWVCNGEDNSAHGCTLGNGPSNGYENGDREGDMGFTCDAA